MVDLLLQHAVDFVPLHPLRQGTDEEKMEIDIENYDAAHTPSIKSKMCKHSVFYSVKLYVMMINLSLRHNVLCFSFVVVFYSMYSLYAIIKAVLLYERNSYV